MKDYKVYHFTWKDWGEFFIRVTVKGLLIGYLFYDSYIMCLMYVPFALLDYQMMKCERIRRQKRQLTLEFKSMMEALITSLTAGYSLERAFIDVKRDLSLLYADDACIFEELERILSGLHMNIPIEKLLQEFGERSRIEDIENFANVIMAAKKNGGNLVHIIEKTVRSISDKIMVEEEIETMIAAKKLEERIMMVMPYGILLYLKFGNKALLNVLYHNVPGAVIMTVFLAGIYAANLWAEKIMDIHV